MSMGIVPKSNRRRTNEEDYAYETNRLEKIREIRLSVLRLVQHSKKEITFEDLVVEEQIPDIGYSTFHCHTITCML